MKNVLIFSALLFCVFSSGVAQDNSPSFYATMQLNDAKELEKEYPEGIHIIEKKRDEAAVLLTEIGAYLLHEYILEQGPGFIYRSNREEAITELMTPSKLSAPEKANFSITESSMVTQVLDKITNKNIANHIKELEDYGTRFHLSPNARKAAEDLKTKWEDMATFYEIPNVNVRLVNHTSTSMPSVIMTIKGSEFPDQYVIAGGHLDSTSSRDDSELAPGADDGGSGIASITEAVRALFESGFQPQKTIEIIAYAAEKAGLKGSNDIAISYKKENKDVIAVAQFDMTNYNGSEKDIYFIENYTDDSLNNFMMSLIDRYNSDGAHEISYSTSVCNYGCSDATSWYNQGYRTTYPFEANIAAREQNPNTHTKDDTFDLIGNADHATKFAKLCAEFLVETAKSGAALLNTNEFTEEKIDVFVKNGTITYELPATASNVKQIQVFDINGRNVYQKPNPENKGTFSLSGIPSGVYIIYFKFDTDKQFSKKISLE